MIYLKKITRNFKLLAIIIFLLTATFARSGWSQNDVVITPYPQKVVIKDFKVEVNSDWGIVVDRSNEANLFSAKLINKKFDNLLIVEGIGSEFKTKHIILALSKDNFVSKEIINITNEVGQEGYILEVFPDSIVIVANDPRGVFYGAQTLFQLASKKENKIVIPAVKVIDYPNLKIRGAHIAGLPGGIEGVKAKLDYLAALKMNMIVFEEDAFWELNKDSFNLGRTNKAVFKELFNYARERHIEPVPELQSFGISAGILGREPHAAEGIWVKDEPFKFVNNMAEPVRQLEITIENPGFETGADGNSVPDGWTFDKGQGRNDWFWDNSTSHSGNYSVKLSIPGTAKKRSNYLKSKWIEVDPDTAYSLSFYAKKTAGSSVNYGLAMRIWQYDSNNKYIVENYCPLQKDAFDWKKHTLNFVTQPNASKVLIWAAIIDGHGTAWFDDIQLKRMSGRLVNVIRTETSDITITNSTKTKNYVEGIDYEIVDGDMKYYDYNSHAPTKIKRIKNGNIQDNEIVLICYDFVLKFHTLPWEVVYCPSEPRTYKIFFEALRDLIGALDPKYIHIGHDEIRGMNRDSRCKRRNMTNAELLGEDINKLNNFMYKIKPDVKMMLWDDMLNPWHNGGREYYQMVFGGRPGKSSDATDLISKDVIPVIWWYDSGDPLKKSLDYFDSRGFHYLVAGWKNKENIQNWLKAVKSEKNCMGMIATTWDGWDNNLEGIKYTANLSWSQ